VKRNLRSTFLWSAFFGCMLPLWAFPAWAYYPPLLTTASYTAQSVTRQVDDPKLQKNVIYTSYFIFGDQQVMDLQQNNGVVAWLWRSGPNYYVTSCTYDPYLANPNPGISTPFQEDTQGPFTSVSQFQVADGVVAYIYVVPPSIGYPTGYTDVKAATYDPAKRAWQVTNPNYTSGKQNFQLLNKDGVVAYNYTYSGAGDRVNIIWAIYDPLKGSWAGDATYCDYQLTYFYTQNGTVQYCFINPEGDEMVRTYGYTIGGTWLLHYHTKPQAYFVAQPASGLTPLWVWFTDMSICATNCIWNFGDGQVSYSRSPYHIYTAAGYHFALQTVENKFIIGGPSTIFTLISVKSGDIGAMLFLLLQ